MNHLLIQCRRIWTRPRRLLVSVLRRRSRNLFHRIVLLASLAMIALGPAPAFFRAEELRERLLAAAGVLLALPLIYGGIWLLAGFLKPVGQRMGGSGDEQDLRIAVAYALLPSVTLAVPGIALHFGAMIWPVLAPLAAGVPGLLTATFLAFLLIEMAEVHELPLQKAAIGLAATALALVAAVYLAILIT